MDLKSKYLGLDLQSPLIAAASPLSRDPESVRKMADAGVGAVVLHSLFEEEIRHAELELQNQLDHGAESFAEAVSYFPDLGYYDSGPDGYLNLVDQIKAVADVPVIASLNGVSPGGWSRYARKLYDAGADALELNVYYMATDPNQDGAAVEQLYLDALRAVRREVTIPVAVKLSPFFSSLPNMAARLARAGADGLVLFNRFYQPDIDIEALEVRPEVRLSNSGSLRLPLRWISILRPQLPDTSLALSTGVHTPEDMVKGLMVGADVCASAAALLQHGPEYAGKLLKGLESWLQEHEYKSLDQLRGSMSHQKVEDPSAFERANYMKALRGYKL